MRNLFTVAGALAALAILFTASFAGLASAQGTVMGASVTPPGIPTTAQVGQLYEIDLRDYLDSFYDPWFGAAWGDNRYVNVGPGSAYREWPSWLEVSSASLRYGENPMDRPRLNDDLILSGIPTEPGTYHVDVEFVQLVSPTSNTVHWTITVPDPIPPTPYTVTLITDPVAEPTSISTSAGSVALTNGAGTILGGTVMHEPQLARDRYIIHRWTDTAGNTYDWTKPVTKDLVLTADWREHFSATVEGNKATVTISSALPGDYASLHQVDWGDNTKTNDLTHLYAAPGDYTITVTSGQLGNVAVSSTVVTVDTVTTVTYTVTFNPAGGSIVPGQTVESGKSATEPQAPTRQGYTFQGWLKDNKPYDFSQPVTGNLYLSASWKAATSGDDDKDDDKDEDSGHDRLLIALGVLSIISLLITLLTRSPYAFAVTIVLALIELALIFLGIEGVIA